MDPLVKLAMDATLRYAMSGLPDAPTVPEPPRRRPDARRRALVARARAAGTLRRLADRLEPRRAEPLPPC
jgi:hypothetical protein